MVNEAPSGRMHWMDVLRGGSVLLVVLFHGVLFGKYTTPNSVLWFSDAAGPYRMPALMFASGILLPRSLLKPTGVFVLGKLRTLAWPWLVWSAVMLPLVGWGLAGTPMWWVNGTHTWFLSVLFTLYLLALVTRWVPMWVLPVALLIAHQIVVAIPGGEIHRFLHDLTWFGVFFYVGALLRDRLLERRFPAAVLPLGLLVSAPWVVHAIKSAGVDRDTLLSAAASLVGVVSLCLVAQKLPRMRALE